VDRKNKKEIRMKVYQSLFESSSKDEQQEESADDETNDEQSEASNTSNWKIYPSWTLCRLIFLLLYQILEYLIATIIISNEGLAYVLLSWQLVAMLLLWSHEGETGHLAYKPRARWRAKVNDKYNQVGRWLINGVQHASTYLWTKVATKGDQRQRVIDVIHWSEFYINLRKVSGKVRALHNRHHCHSVHYKKSTRLRLL